MAYPRHRNNNNNNNNATTVSNGISSSAWVSSNRAVVITDTCEYYTDSSVVQQATRQLETLLQQYTGGRIYITTVEMSEEGTEFELNTLSTQEAHLLNNVIVSLDAKKWSIQERRPTVPNLPVDTTIIGDGNNDEYASPNVKVFILKHSVAPFLTIGLLMRIIIGLGILFLGSLLLYLSYSALETTTL